MEVYSKADSAAALTPVDLPMDEVLSDSSFNCRGPISPFEVRELAQDIKVRGLQFPIAVQPYTDASMPGIKYRILAGHRRHMACKVIGKTTIPSVIKPGLSEVDAIVFNLSENIKRADLNPLQEAKSIERLRNNGWTPTEISKGLGVPYGWAASRLKILELPEEIQKELASGLLKLTDVKKLSELASVEQQYEMARQIKDNRLLGKKKEPKLKPKTANQKRSRNRSEINAFQINVLNILGPTFATRALAWAQGEIDDHEVHTALQEEAEKIDRFYSIPLAFRESA